MGNDARIQGLSTAQDAEVADLVSTLRLEVDDPTYINAESKQMLLASLLSNRDVPDNTTVAHKAVTEAGLMKTNATFAKKGVVKLATTQDVDVLSGSVALSPDAHTYAMEKQTADNYYSTSGGNLGAIYDRTFPSNSLFQGAISITKVGAMLSLSGAIVVAFGGSVSKFEVWFKGTRKPAHECALSVTVDDNGTFKACGAYVVAEGNYTVLTIHSPAASSLSKYYINGIYQSVV